MEIGDGGVRTSSSDFLYRVTQSSRAWGIYQNALPTLTKLPRLSSFGPAIFIFCPVYGPFGSSFEIQRTLRPFTVMAPEADDDYLKLFEGIEEQPIAAKSDAGGATIQQSEQDILAELDYLTAERPKASISRPHTPRLAPSPSTKGFERSRTPVGRISGEGYGYGLPPTRRDSGDVGVRRAERASLDTTTPATLNSGKETKLAPARGSAASVSESTTAGSGAESAVGGWGWGSIWSTATAAVKTAEGMVKEIQQSEDAKRWADQVKGNAEVLRGLGRYSVPFS